VKWKAGQLYWSFRETHWT